jgi:hypothetical protein
VKFSRLLVCCSPRGGTYRRYSGSAWTGPLARKQRVSVVPVPPGFVACYAPMPMLSIGNDIF